MEDAALILEVESGTLLFLSLQQNYGRQPGWSRANANIFPNDVRYVQKVPLAAELLDVRRSQKLQMVKDHAFLPSHMSCSVSKVCLLLRIHLLFFHQA